MRRDEEGVGEGLKTERENWSTIQFSLSAFYRGDERNASGFTESRVVREAPY